MGNLTTFHVILSPEQVSSLKKRAVHWGIMKNVDSFSQTIFEAILLALTLPERAKGGLRLQSLQKKLQASSLEESENTSDHSEDERPWSELDPRRQNERLREAADHLQHAFAKAEKCLSMRDELGDLVGLSRSIGSVLEYLMSATKGARTALTLESVPATLARQIEKNLQKRMTYKSRFMHLQYWAKWAQGVSVDQFRSLASCGALQRGMVPRWEEVVEHNKKRITNYQAVFSDALSIYRTRYLGFHFDLEPLAKAMALQQILHLYNQNPALLKRMLQEGPLRILLSVGGDGFNTSRTAHGNCIGLYAKITITPHHGKARLADLADGDQKMARNVMSGDTFTVALFTGGEHRANLKRQLTHHVSDLDNMKPQEVLAALGTMTKDGLKDACSRFSLPTRCAEQELNKSQLVSAITSFLSEPKNQITLTSPIFNPPPASEVEAAIRGTGDLKLESTPQGRRSLMDAMDEINGAKGVALVPKCESAAAAGDPSLPPSLTHSLLPSIHPFLPPYLSLSRVSPSLPHTDT